MGVKIWISRDYASNELVMWDEKPHYDSYGPIEVSNELYKRARETEREFDTIQGVLEDAIHDWNYPDD